MLVINRAPNVLSATAEFLIQCRAAFTDQLSEGATLMRVLFDATDVSNYHPTTAQASLVPWLRLKRCPA